MGAFGLAVGPELWLPYGLASQGPAQPGNIEPHSGFRLLACQWQAGGLPREGAMRQHRLSWVIPYPR